MQFHNIRHLIYYGFGFWVLNMLVQVVAELLEGVVVSIPKDTKRFGMIIIFALKHIAVGGSERVFDLIEDARKTLRGGAARVAASVVPIGAGRYYGTSFT
jgi:hypothetical protein